MSPSTVEYLRHIWDETGYLTAQSRKVTQIQFHDDDTLKRAFVRSLEIIGEAARNTAMSNGDHWQVCVTS